MLKSVPVQKVFIILDNKFRTVHYSSIPESTQDFAEIRGKYPWDFAHPDWREHVKASFERCMKTRKPDFHVGRLGEQSAEFPGQNLCAWLWPVEPFVEDCPNQCASILCHVIVVPPNMEKLSPKERKIVEALGGGHTPNDIAKMMDLRITTVNTQLWRAREKLGLTELVEVAVWASIYKDILGLDKKLFKQAVGEAEVEKTKKETTKRKRGKN